MRSNGDYEKVRMMVVRLRGLQEEVDEHRTVIITREKQLVEKTEELYLAKGELLKEMGRLDVVANQNRGWEDRVVMFLTGIAAKP